MAAIGDTVHSRAYSRFDTAYQSCAKSISEHTQNKAVIKEQFEGVRKRYEVLTSASNQEVSPHPLSRLLQCLCNLWRRFCAWFCCDRTPPVNQKELNDAERQWKILQEALTYLEIDPSPQTDIPHVPSVKRTPTPSPTRIPAPLPTMPPPLALAPTRPTKSPSKISVGLGNAGNNCWINAFLQPMRRSPQIRETYEQIAHALAEDEEAQNKAAENHIRQRNEKCELEDEQRQAHHARWIPFLAEKRGNAAASAMLRSLSPKESFESLFTRRFKHAPAPLPDIPPQAAAATPEAAFTQAFEASLHVILPHVLQETLPYLQKGKPLTLDAHLSAVCLIALRLAWTHASTETPSLKEKDQKALISRIAADLVSVHMTEFLTTNQEELIGPPPAPVSREGIPSLEEAKIQAREHGQHMLAFLNDYEVSLQGNASPLPSKTTQQIRRAFYFFCPREIRPSGSQEDVYVAFNILNTAYGILFGKENAPPFSMNVTLHKTYQPIEEPPPASLLDPEGFRLRQATSKHYLIDHPEEDLPEGINQNSLFTLLGPENTTAYFEPRFEFQFSWKKSTSSKVKLSYETLAQNYFSPQFTVQQKEEEATYMQANGEVRQFVKIQERVTLDEPPEGFLVTLKRFETNPQTGAVIKKNDPVDMPLQIQLPETAVGDSPMYRLVGIIEHTLSSSPHGGHYISYVHDPETMVWEKADDSRISRHCTSKDIETARKVGYLFFYIRENAS